ncbi:hypothetical protein Q9L58_005499 [Maublancomyces gigas]|uniref:Myb-like DNA-binding domain-containing protein n=1 Tax=Discina gigas TaxID=1032678 RepID=A0ABR3GI93_9PEZI
MTSKDDCKFLLSCLNTSGKIDFEVVAKEYGYLNPRSASNRLYAIKKSAATGAATGTDTDTTGATSSDKPTTMAPRIGNAKVTKRKPGPRKGGRVSGLMTQLQGGIESSNGQKQEEKLQGGEVKQDEEGEKKNKGK